jgi:Bacterial tandem repeat domain 1
MRRFMMTVTALAAFGVTVATAQAETSSPGNVPPGYSDWATSADYQKLFDAMVQQRRYPRVVEARVFNGIVSYRAAFEPYPVGCSGLACTFSFLSHHGINPDLFAQRDDSLRRDGFRLVHKQSVYLGGRDFIQATWVRIARQV